MTYTDEQITDLIAEARAWAKLIGTKPDGARALFDRLAAALEASLAELGSLRNVAKDYDANFPCDGGCNYNDGPEETCSRHGRAPKDLWERVEQGYRAQAERDALRAVLDDIRAEQQDYTIPHDEALSNIGEILSRAIDTKETK